MKSTRSGANQNTVLIRIAGDIGEPNSGASANVMDEYKFKGFKHELSKDTLKILQSDSVVKGKFSVTLQNKNREYLQFFSDQREDGLSTTSKQEHTEFELGMLRIDLAGTLICTSIKETNELRVAVKPPADNIKALLDE